MATDTGARAVKRERDMRRDPRINRDARMTVRRIMRKDPDGNDIEVLRVEGYASVTDEPYEMYSWFGNYNETVASGAFEKTLEADPKVILRANHIDLPLASTNAGTLQLAEDDTGLWFGADMDARRGDAQDLFYGIERGDIDETSFAGWIEAYTESGRSMDWTLDEIDLNRGDVAVVSFGANPHGSVAAVRDRTNAGLSDADIDRLAERVIAGMERSQRQAAAINRDLDGVISGPGPEVLAR